MIREFSGELVDKLGIKKGKCNRQVAKRMAGENHGSAATESKKRTSYQQKDLKNISIILYNTVRTWWHLTSAI